MPAPQGTGARNPHPTVKPLALMRWLVRLTKTPARSGRAPGGIVLDPFAGSGTTLCAAVLEGRSFLACDQEESYVAIANARVAHWRGVAAQEARRYQASLFSEN